LAWRSRSNCDRCMYAGQYERIGLWEHHPDRYEDACQLEERLCHKPELTWVQGYRLRDFPARAAIIKERRARTVVKYLRTKLVRTLWEDGGAPADDLQATSCGLFCGK
jgi:hypothetical protein